MSYQATRWACGQRAGSAPAKAVLMVLAEHANKTGLSWPSTRTIADESECDQRSVRRHLDGLRDRGLVTVEPGAGKASNRYQLAMTDPVVRHPDASTNDDVVRHPDASTNDDVVRHPDASLAADSDDASEALDHRSEALDHRSEATRASDQQRSEQNNYVEPVTTEQAAPPPRGRGGARPREAATPAELHATAHRPDAAAIVSTWCQHNPGMTGPRQRELRKAVSVELDRGADPVLIPAALDEAHGNPKWHHPVKALPLAYEQVRRAAQQAARPVAVVPDPQPENRTDANIRALMAGAARPEQIAIGGNR